MLAQSRSPLPSPSIVIQAFQQHLQRSQLLPPPEEAGQVVVACSGGADSVALLYLLHRLGYSLSVAHVNHHLRDEASDEDEQSVRDHAAHLGLGIEVFHADPEALKAAPEGLQAAARKIRYAFFSRYRADAGASLIVTAHQLDDLVEGYLWHLMRGSHWRGFAGIPERHEALVRPLLPFRSKELRAWLRSEGISWREDPSNLSSDYSRNRIRHELIPLMESIRPGFQRNVLRQVAMFREVSEVLTPFLSQLSEDLLFLGEDGLRIAVEGLSELHFKRLLLSEALQGFGFHAKRVDEVLALLASQPGSALYSKSHRILREREHLLISLLPEDSEQEVFIAYGQEELHHPLPLRIRYGRSEELHISDDPNIALFDREALNFPLVLRAWQAGDRIRPLGLKGSVKLSDLFTQAGYSLADKESAFVLCSEGEVIWVPGLRMAERVKVKPNSKELVEFRWLR